MALFNRIIEKARGLWIILMLLIVGILVICLVIGISSLLFKLFLFLTGLGVSAGSMAAVAGGCVGFHFLRRLTDKELKIIFRGLAGLVAVLGFATCIKDLVTARGADRDRLVQNIARIEANLIQQQKGGAALLTIPAELTADQKLKWLENELQRIQQDRISDAKGNGSALEGVKRDLASSEEKSSHTGWLTLGIASIAAAATTLNAMVNYKKYQDDREEKRKKKESEESIEKARTQADAEKSPLSQLMERRTLARDGNIQTSIEEDIARKVHEGRLSSEFRSGFGGDQP